MVNAKRIFGTEAEMVPEEYQEWAWGILHPRMEELVALGARHAAGWLLSHRRTARLPELLAGNELADNARSLATDAFLAIYFHQHPLKNGVDPRAHIISVINSLAANKLRRGDNWDRAPSEVGEAAIAKRHADLAGHASSEGQQAAATEGKREDADRKNQKRLAAEMKASLPSDRIFEAALVEAIGALGLRDRRQLARELKTTVEDVRVGLTWLLEHIREKQPALADSICSLALDAVPATTITGNVVVKQ